MKKTTLIIFFTIMTLSGFAQEDWFGFNRYRADNERIITNGEFPEGANGIVPLISSIPPCSSFVWNPDIKDAAQTIVGINKRLQAYADANGIAYVDYYAALADKQGGLPKTFSDDGCHPNSDTYYIMEKLVLEKLKTKN